MTKADKQKPVIKCEYTGCPLVAEWELRTSGKDKFYYCELHRMQLKKLRIVASETSLKRG